ncbi:MAG: VOC family protein [Rhodothermales bacterium]|nr:VOC family protein [Rhodothermales bacterium]
MSNEQQPRLIGINHVALEVGDVEQALQFYGKIFSFALRGSNEDETGRMTMAFIDMGDQFLALSEGRTLAPDSNRHVGLVVDDRSSVCERAIAAGGHLVGNARLDFVDPWGNRIQVVEYRDIQFSKTDAMLSVLGVSGQKSEDAIAQLQKKSRKEMYRERKGLDSKPKRSGV